MRVRSLAWVGFAVTDTEATSEFLVKVLGLDTMVVTDSFVALRADNGDVVEVFRDPADPSGYLAHGPVPGLEVDDLDASADELRSAGAEILGPIHVGSHGSRWLHFRIPGGLVFELIEPQRGVPSSNSGDN